MVKRIKKRVPKKNQADAPEGTGAAAAATAAAPADDGQGAGSEASAPTPPANTFRAEIESLAEDDFTRTVAGGVGWVAENRALIIGGVGLTIAVVVVILVMQGQKTSGMEEAATAFNDAAETYVEAVRSPAPNSETPALTDDERKARIEKAAGAFERSRTTYADQPIVGVAALGEANSKLALGDVDGALSLYDQALKTDLPPFSKAVALQGKAAALETKGDRQGAMDAWKAVEGVDSAAFGLMAGLQMGRLLEAEGKADEAKALYERLLTDHAAALEQLANRTVKADIDRRLALLGKSS